VRPIYLNNPALDKGDFLRLLAGRFDLGADAADSKALFLERLEHFLLERRAGGETMALVIDEAQSLSLELLEEIRLLANIETPSAKLLPLVLAGQLELATRLEDPSIRQLKQRVTLRCQIEPFNVAETAAYIASRVSTAGGAATQLFSREAVTLIYEHSGGIARSINVICDNALVSGMALGRKSIDRAIVMEVCRDLRLDSHRERVTSMRPSRTQEIAAPAREEARDDVAPPERLPARVAPAALPRRAGRIFVE
jgi:type II secretory pathway predicted ATPase ExeA